VTPGAIFMVESAPDEMSLAERGLNLVQRPNWRL
jgi:hypothetical protein